MLMLMLTLELAQSLLNLLGAKAAVQIDLYDYCGDLR